LALAHWWYCYEALSSAIQRFESVLGSLNLHEVSLAIWLEELTWCEAEAELTPDRLVILPIGAAAKEHGPHLRLNNDRVLAEYLTRRVAEHVDAVIAPTLTYHFYPAFVEYPGSISLRLETARDLMIDACRSLAAYGPRQFYALNFGVSTIRPLRLAAEHLQAEHITLSFTDLISILEPIEQTVAEQPGGSHADEIETSMMLYVAPERVDMQQAVKEYNPAPGPFTRDPHGKGAYSASGIYGDPTLATVEKGRIVVEALVAALVEEIRAII
jgi:creatinine amidohydrolase